jgi:hypothetical protein
MSPIGLNWQDVRNADMNELYEMIGRLSLFSNKIHVGKINKEVKKELACLEFPKSMLGKKKREQAIT